MSQLSCDIIRDLLPLYVDEVCSEQSKDAVKEHLDCCVSCSQECEAMREKPPDILSEETAFDKDIKWLKRKLKFKSARPVIILGILILSACLFFSFFPNILRPLLLISPEKIHVTELYELKDGGIYCTLKSNEKIARVSQSGIFVPSPTQANVTSSNGWSSIEFSSFSLSPANNKISECSFVFSLKDETRWMDDPEQEEIIKINSTAIYYIGKFNQKKLVWEKGQKIERAPIEIEEKVAREREQIAQYDDFYVLNGGLPNDLVILPSTN